MKTPESAIIQSRAFRALASCLIPAVGLIMGLAALHLAGAAFEVVLVALVLSVAAGITVILLASHQGVFLGWANQVTLARLALVAALAAVLLQPALYAGADWWLTAVALVALGLDGLDGWLARRLGESSAFGARFDMEVDAALIMVLSIAVLLAGDLGPWVLLLGVMRYGFVLSASIWPWLDAPLPTSFRRKLVCVWQVCALVVAIMPLSGLLTQQLVLSTALAGLLYSFAVDIRWLWSRRAAPYAEQVMS
ncbi:MAG: CDP-alcohol phosphatidyltransferase family protein [Wenzhouxiangella sp.]|nr:CDP-alcohol phosphatidyltransferase family protein [Wenzhouxiangella sp.]